MIHSESLAQPLLATAKPNPSPATHCKTQPKPGNPRLPRLIQTLLSAKAHNIILYQSCQLSFNHISTSILPSIKISQYISLYFTCPRTTAAMTEIQLFSLIGESPIHHKNKSVDNNIISQVEYLCKLPNDDSMDFPRTEEVT
eukprot:scaffold3374_cov141-Cylindrotheca_fusiformis.AAC.1